MTNPQGAAVTSGSGAPPLSIVGRLRRIPVAAWLADHPFVADAILAAAVIGIGVGTMEHIGQTDQDIVRQPDALAYTLAVLGGVLLVWRRRAPVLVVIGNSLLIGAYFALDYPSGPVGLSNMVAVYTLASLRPRRLSIPLVGVLVLAATISEIATGESVVDILANFPIFILPWAIGDSVRTRRKYLAHLEERAARLEQERAERDRQAVADERARIARELHDVVAHNVGVMVVQAGAARSVLDTRPDDARTSLLAIEATGRDALGEMRRLLGVLREDDEATAARGPQPGVTDLESLAQKMRTAGLPVQLEVEGTADALPPAVELCVYRVVQEALTNTLKHAGPARASVRVRYRPSAVDVEVEDDGRGTSARRDGTEGHGLIGMRERVALYGGELCAEPRVDGGFVVRATLPLEVAHR